MHTVARWHSDLRLSRPGLFSVDAGTFTCRQPVDVDNLGLPCGHVVGVMWTIREQGCGWTHRGGAHACPPSEGNFRHLEVEWNGLNFSDVEQSDNDDDVPTTMCPRRCANDVPMR